MTYIRILIFINILTIILVAQINKISVSQIEEAYNNINFERSILLSGQAIENDTLYSVDELVEIYKLRGFTFFHLGKEKEAEKAFNTVLTLHPNLELDPVTVSPKIIDFFNGLKQENTTTISNTINLENKYILVEDPRPSSALRSLILPGWGQYYKGEKNKSYIVFSVFTLNSTALIISLIKEKSSRDDYLNSKEANTIQSKYDTYNSWSKTRQYLTYSEIIIWAYAFADALWNPVNKNKSFSVNFTTNSFSLTYLF